MDSRMEPNNETAPNEDGFQIVGPEPSANGGQQDEPQFEELLQFLQEQVPDFEDLLGAVGGGIQRDAEQHDAQMELVNAQQRSAMATSDQEQNDSDSSEAEPLAWGLWRSQCGCLHLSVPDGDGGWASNIEQVNPEKLLETIQDMVRGLGEAGLTMLRALASTEEGI